MTKHRAPPAPWGTLEDLLLAFAVNRHGTTSWESIASELQKRASDPSLFLTPQTCRSKYLDLKRRFADDVDDDKSDAEVSGPLLEELRKLRVAELRREVQRYDLNIESLELKVKKMEEERERSLREESETDLEKKSERNIPSEPDSEPVTAGEPVAGEELEKDQLSMNESNSTDLGAEKLKTGEKEPEPARTGADDARRNRTGQVSEEPTDLKPEPDRKLVPENSCNGSSNSIRKSNRKAKFEPENDSNGLIEPEGESDGGDEEATKENSEVQSSASRSRKEVGNTKLRRGSTSGDEREREDQSRAVKELSAESQPLVDFLQSIRAEKFGSVFERRLRSQETSKYQKLILQHIDLETIETRTKEGWYSGSSSKFFRDLLLLVNNALVFFGDKSTEAKAAVQLRQLISKEISQKHAKPNSTLRKQVSLQSLSASKKEEPEPSHSLALKPRISGSLTFCRKRSSIAAKASGVADKKKEQQSEDKSTKRNAEQSGSAEEPKITKKRTRERFPSIPANTKKNGNNQSNNRNKNSVPESGKQQGKGGSSSSQPAEPKSESKKSQTTLESKKRGAANFLNRMKQGSSSNNGVLLDALKNRPLTTSESTSSKGGGSEVKKNENAKRGGEKKETAATKGKQQAKEKVSPGKRNVGRPPKRGAALGKRGREKVETETPNPKPAKKRTRKL